MSPSAAHRRAATCRLRRRALAALPLALLASLLLVGSPVLDGCLGAGRRAAAGRPGAAAAEPVPLTLTAEPADVEILIDGAYVGELSRWRDGRLPVAPGLRRLELQRAGFFPLRRTIEVGPAGASFHATLRRIPAGYAPAPAPPPLADPLP